MLRLGLLWLGGTFAAQQCLGAIEYELDRPQIGLLAARAAFATQETLGAHELLRVVRAAAANVAPDPEG